MSSNSSSTSNITITSGSLETLTAVRGTNPSNNTYYAFDENGISYQININAYRSFKTSKGVYILNYDQVPVSSITITYFSNLVIARVIKATGTGVPSIPASAGKFVFKGPMTSAQIDNLIQQNGDTIIILDENKKILTTLTDPNSPCSKRPTRRHK